MQMRHPLRKTAIANPRVRCRSDQATLGISLSAIQENYLTLTERLSSYQACVAAVVKADAYGLGTEQVAPALWKVGARVFFVAHIAEALTLRQVLPEAAVYVLSGLRRADLSLYAHYRLIPVLNQMSEIELWLEHAVAKGQKTPAAIHFDTGMARMGLEEGEVRNLKKKAKLLKAFSPILYLSHLACAEVQGNEGNLVQLAAFQAAIAGLPLGQTSIANSSACFLPADYALDLARPGAALYGINPTPDAANPMQAAIGLSAPLLQVRALNEGDTIGYGSTWIAKNESQIATLSIGYADGLFRSISNSGQVFIDGIPCPIVGRVSMDLTTIDVSHLRPDQYTPGVQVEIIGPHQSIDDLAKASSTIGYEVLTNLGNRLARSYIGA